MNKLKFTKHIALFICIITLSIIGLFNTEIGSSKSQNDFFYTITTNHHGINASEIERIITIPMEESISMVTGISEITSYSKYGESKIFIKSGNTADHSEIYLNIRDKVDLVYQKLPSAVQKPQIYSSSSLSSPSYVIAFSSTERDLPTLRYYIDQEIKHKFEKIDDTGLIEISGGGIKEIHIQIDPKKAAQFGIEANQIASFLQQNNIYTPIGDINSGNIEKPIILNSQIQNIETIKDLFFNYNNMIIPLKEIANIEYGYREPESLSRVNGEQHIVLYVYSSGDANLIKLSNNIMNLLNSLEDEGYTFKVIYNEGEPFKQKLKELFIILFIEFALVLVVLLFFGTVKQRLLITGSLPITLLITIAILSFLRITIDQFILSGLAVGIGLMADTGIILTTFFEKHPNKSYKPTVVALVSSTLTTLIVLLPTIAMKSIMPGIQEITVSIAVLSIVNLCLNLLFIPPFYSRSVLKSKEIAIDSFITKIALRFINLPKKIFVIHVLIFLATATMFVLTNKDFSRDQQKDTLFVQFEFPSGYSQHAVDREIIDWQNHINIDSFIKTWEVKANRGNARSTIRIDTSKITKEKLINEIRRNEKYLTHGEIHFTQAPTANGFKFEIHVSGSDTTVLQNLCKNAISIFQKNDWVHTGVVHFKENPPAFKFQPMDDSLSKYGLTPAFIGSQLKWYIQGPVAMKIPNLKKEIDVRIMATKESIRNLSDIQNIPASTKSGIIPIDSILSSVTEEEPTTIIRRNKQRSHSFSFIAEIKDLDLAMNRVKTVLNTIPLPTGYFFEIDRTLIREKKNLQNIFIAMAFALFFVYVILAGLLESFKIPIIIISILPATMFLPILFLILANLSLTTSAVIGFILLCGISVNNSILLCEGADSLKSSPNSSFAHEIVVAAFKDRVPALITTTLTTILASLPLALLTIRDQSFSNILALIVFLGMISSFIASVILIPAIIARFYH